MLQQFLQGLPQLGGFSNGCLWFSSIFQLTRAYESVPRTVTSQARPLPARTGLFQHHGTKTMQKILVDQFGLTSEPKLWISTIRSVVCLESHDDFMIWSFPGISSHHKCWHQGPKGSSQNCQLSFVLLSSLCGLLFSCRFKFACHAYTAEIHETSQDTILNKSKLHDALHCVISLIWGAQ